LHKTGHPTNNTQFGNVVGTKGLGIDQTGNTNVLTISQDGYGLQAFEIQQSGGTGTASTSNSIAINQTGGRASVSEVTQDFTGVGAGAANSVEITQTGGSNLVGNTSTGPTNTGGVFQT